MSADLASLIRLRYPRLLEPGNQLYDAVLAAAVEEQGKADVVTAPMEECLWAWVEDLPTASWWRGACSAGRKFELGLGPAWDGFRFCPHCGRRIGYRGDEPKEALRERAALRSTQKPEATP